MNTIPSRKSDATADVLKAAVRTAIEQGIGVMLVASTTGTTAVQLLPLISGTGIRLVVATTGNSRSGKTVGDSIRAQLQAGGAVLVSKPPEAFILRKIRKVLYHLRVSPSQNRLRRIQNDLGTGARVCFKIAHMAASAGIIGTGKIVAIAGTKRGADCAVVIEIRAGSHRPELNEIIIGAKAVR